jgi:hypothetical protein
VTRKAGGGINSKQHVSKPVRYGDRATKINPRGVAQIGTNRGNHATTRSALLTGDVEPVSVGKNPAGGPGSVTLGNEITTNVKGGGPGKGRVLYGQSGSNQTYGPVAGAPKPQGRDILSEFGGESKPRRG